MELQNGYYLKEMTPKEFFPLFGKHYQSLFGNDHTFFADKYYSESENNKMEKLKERMGNLFALHIGLFSKNNEFVGFTFGFQESEEVFYMACSAVLPEYRRSGLYTELVKFVIKRTSDEGFQKIYGTHCATNNAVIIPKLKLGFIFSKLELSDTFGTIIHLQYFTNPLRRKVMDYRSGQRIPDQEMKTVMKLN